MSALQEQAEKGDWNYKLSAVYTVGVLDFIFDDHKADPTIMHVVELKNQQLPRAQNAIAAAVDSLR